MKQTILGSGGGIGTPLARELRAYTNDIRLVSRNPKKVNETDELFPTDLTNRDQLEKAIMGSEVVYVTVGFPYSLKVWEATWPTFMENVIISCVKHGSKLVFVDNVYMYARKAIPFMTEDAPIDPPSKKGQVREKLRTMLLSEIEKGNLKALIARSADFYGPENQNSAIGIMAIDNLLKGKKAQVLGNPDKIHTYTYTPDAAKAIALLGNTPDAYQQEWHLPTTKEKLTNRQWIELIAKELHKDCKIQTVPTWMVKLLGLFVPIMREFPEMIYQNEEDYIFDSSKFEKRFGWMATTPAEGIRKTIQSLK